MVETVRRMMNDYAWSFIGRWYSWGGDDPMGGFDCSGFTSEVAKAFGALRRNERLSANEQWMRFSKYRVGNAQGGCLVFFASPTGQVNHVEYCLNSFLSVGASGGNSKTITIQDAIRDNAFIKLRPILRKRERKGFVDLAKVAVDGLIALEKE